MKTAWLGCSTLALVFACGGGGTDIPPATAGSGSGGSSAGTGTGGTGVSNSGTAGQSSGGSGNGGSGAGGASAGTSMGGSGNGGTSAGAGAGAGGGSAGSSGSGGAAQGFTCPAGPFDAPTLTVTPTRVAGVPPADAFNNDNNDFTNIEGAVWVGDALYVSEISGKGSPPPSRILKITADDKVSVVVPDSGTNGMAVNGAGELFGCKHSDGSVSKIALPGGTATPVASMFMSKRFGSPNDLAIHKNGTIYFTDPSYQAPMPNPQSATRAYRVPAGGMPVPFEEQLSQPNGVTLSKNQDFLYVAGSNGMKKYPVMADGAVGTGAPFGDNSSSDGMTLDCADNLYITNNGVVVFNAAGMKLGTITVTGLGQATNVAFGGADHKTLYITGQGSGMQKGLFKATMNVPGFPY